MSRVFIDLSNGDGVLWSLFFTFGCWITFLNFSVLATLKRNCRDLFFHIRDNFIFFGKFLCVSILPSKKFSV